MIKAENLSYEYKEHNKTLRKALNNISFEIPKGTVTAIIGATGSGKSTLSEHFNALKLPTSGKLTVCGTELSEEIKHSAKSIKDLRKRVGLVFQYPEHQLFAATVYDDIAFAPKNMGITGDELNKRVSDSIKLVGLKDGILQKSPFLLSGGEMRRVAIAGVLSAKPEILVLDEPTASLDPKGRAEIMDLIKNLHKTYPDMTLIFVSHSMDEVSEIADRIIALSDGKIIADGSVNEVFKNADKLADFNIRVPEITKLMKKLKAKGYNVSTEIYTKAQALTELKRLLNSKNN